QRSQIRIYDLQTHKELRRIELPRGSRWSVKSWEGNQLSLERSCVDSFDGSNFATSRRENRINLDEDPPHPVEDNLFRSSQDATKPFVEITDHRRGAKSVLRAHTWANKKSHLPEVLQKLIEWSPSSKSFIDDYYPENGTELTMLDPVSGTPLWDCRRVFSG